MRTPTAMALGAAATILFLAPAASAQEAAETAVLTGVGAGQAKAQRSLGSAVSRSVDGAAAAVRAGSKARGSRASRRARANQPQPSLPAGVDALEGTDAPSYKLGNGVTIRVSRGMNAGTGTICLNDCPAPAEEAEVPE